MIRFESDYLEGALPEVMEALVRTNLEQTPGYGEDEHCARAAQLIREKCAAPEAAVHFLVGGTQANMTVIAAALRPHQAAVAADTGHISVHETGAVEATGHKVITLPSPDGKISAGQVRDCVEAHWADSTHEHQPQPALVYISQPTENGTVYSLAELEAMSAVCREKGLLLFVDGARMGAALASSDVTLPDLARLTDVFYIGGTKLGALFGEAVVITNEALMEDGLYERTGAREVALAMRLRAAFEKKGWPLLYDSPTNQQFPIVPDAALEELAKDYSFSDWARVDGTHRAVRFCTSWATREEDVDKLIADIARL